MGFFFNYVSDFQDQIVLSVVKDCESEIQMSSTGDFPMSQVNGLQCCLSEGKDRSSSNHILGGPEIKQHGARNGPEISTNQYALDVSHLLQRWDGNGENDVQM